MQVRTIVQKYFTNSNVWFFNQSIRSFSSLYSEEYTSSFMDNVVSTLHSYFEYLLKSLQQDESCNFHNNDPRHPGAEKTNGLRMVEKTIGDFLASLMLFASVKKAGSYLLTEIWVKCLLEVLRVNAEGVPRVNSLRPKLLAIKLLATILPDDVYHGSNKSSFIHIYDSEYKQKVSTWNDILIRWVASC